MYFERTPHIPKNILQLVGATALLIAHKIEVTKDIPSPQLYNVL